VNDVCLQHGIVGFVKRTTVTQLLAILQQFGICDHQDASSEGQKDGHLMIPRPHTALQTAAMLHVFSWECLKHPLQSPDFTSSDSHLFGPLEKHNGGHRFQNAVGLQEALSWWFFHKAHNSMVKAYIMH
jgi:hypothetical protein